MSIKRSWAMQFVVLTSLRTLDMHISMPIFMLVSGFFVVSMFFTKATQVQPTDVLNSQSRCATAFKNPSTGHGDSDTFRAGERTSSPAQRFWCAALQPQ
ncbi:TPA: hypothetical protein NL044_000367 [Pseudomonas aeruginosa]|nr:hypothetical protein [Pseudomonas aeruginosa]